MGFFEMIAGFFQPLMELIGLKSGTADGRMSMEKLRLFRAHANGRIHEFFARREFAYNQRKQQRLMRIQARNQANARRRK